MARIIKTLRKVPRPIDRDQALEIYENMEVKREFHNDMSYMMSESPASSFYASLDPRRRVEMADGGMVQEDRNAVANLSPRFIHREFPRNNFSSGPYSNDDSTQEE